MVFCLSARVPKISNTIQIGYNPTYLVIRPLLSDIPRGLRASACKKGFTKS